MAIPSQCTLFFRFQDRVTHLKHLIGIEDASHRACAKKRLDEKTKFCIGKECRKQAMLQYFNDRHTHNPCQVCDVCLNSSEQLTEMTAPANDLINCVSEILTVQTNVSSKYITFLTKGLRRGKRDFKHDKGALKLLHLLISMGFLIENLSLDENQSTPFITVDERTQLSDASITI